ncbi:hypothetical protein [Haloglomus salinum]|jgi:hypothetical protein|uniref:hypothetical protein n=1 Tax=Haloglomus salinum TaxID=2962673 RepID=UPI0020C9D6AA|nr:hypothetical protein [Haloglomus salinum]
MNRREALSRALLVGTAGGLVTLAGCSTDGGSGGDGSDAGGTDDGEGEDGPGGGGDEDEGMPDSADPTPTQGDSPTQSATDGGLDLREANVTGVTVEQQSGRAFRFDVTLYHDDDGEDGYANWWQIETRDGERLGQRELLHAHGTREFTRSETIEVPESHDCVVVRGHDEVHEYGGQAALVRVSTGEVRFVNQGPDRMSQADEDCP